VNSFHLLSVAAGIEPRSLKSLRDGQSWLSDTAPVWCSRIPASGGLLT
jgi:hypothetical protein